MYNGVLTPIYKYKHQSNSCGMELIPIIVKVKIRDITHNNIFNIKLYMLVIIIKYYYNFGVRFFSFSSVLYI